MADSIAASAAEEKINYKIGGKGSGFEKKDPFSGRGPSFDGVPMSEIFAQAAAAEARQASESANSAGGDAKLLPDARGIVSLPQTYREQNRYQWVDGEPPLPPVAMIVNAGKLRPSGVTFDDIYNMKSSTTAAQDSALLAGFGPLTADAAAFAIKGRSLSEILYTDKITKHVFGEVSPTYKAISSGLGMISDGLSIATGAAITLVGAQSTQVSGLTCS